MSVMYIIECVIRMQNKHAIKQDSVCNVYLQLQSTGEIQTYLFCIHHS